MQGWITCGECGKVFHSSFPHDTYNDVNLCLDCLLKLELITSKEYLQNCGLDIKGYKAKYIKSKNYIQVIKSSMVFEDEEFKGKYRHNDANHTHWRKQIFERDNFTCQKCGQVGGELNAHHIKPYKQYIKLRYVIENGITLCKKCHKEEHKKKVVC